LWLLSHASIYHGAIISRFLGYLRTRDRSRIDKIGLLDDWRWLFDPLAEDVSLEEVRKPHRQLIVEETLGGDREDLCEKL
jgi:hypothetical protein